MIWLVALTLAFGIFGVLVGPAVYLASPQDETRDRWDQEIAGGALFCSGVVLLIAGLAAVM